MPMVNEPPVADHRCTEQATTEGAPMITQTQSAVRAAREAVAPVIVVGYDGLEQSRRAVQVAAQRAGPQGTLVVVRATEPVSRMMRKVSYDHAVAVTRVTAERSFDRLAGADLGDVTIEPQVVVGDPTEALLQVAQARDAREIVVGSRGLGRLRSALGSVSHRLLERADRPVVVVPAPSASRAG